MRTYPDGVSPAGTRSFKERVTDRASVLFDPVPTLATVAVYVAAGYLADDLIADIIGLSPGLVRSAAYTCAFIAAFNILTRLGRLAGRLGLPHRQQQIRLVTIGLYQAVVVLFVGLLATDNTAVLAEAIDIPVVFARLCLGGLVLLFGVSVAQEVYRLARQQQPTRAGTDE